MGWTQINDAHLIGNKAAMDELFNSPDESKVIKSAFVGDEYYAAVKNLKNNKVVGVVCLVEEQVNDGTSLYKVMYEDEGPNADHCPKEILNALTETKNEFANEWRKRCKRHFVQKSR